MLVSKNAKICLTPKAKPKICISPNANPQRESVEYRLHWVSWCWVIALGMYISRFCVDFICVGYPMQTFFEWNMGLKVLVDFNSPCHLHILMQVPHYQTDCSQLLGLNIRYCLCASSAKA